MGGRLRGRQLAQEMAGQGRDVLAAIAERRDPQHDDLQAIIEILAEAALADQGGEVAVGGGDDAHVDDLGPLLAEREHFAVLEEA